MMPEEWPVAVPAAQGSAAPRSMTRDRLTTVRRDFFLDPAKRLTEQERALMSAMLHGLVGEIADDLRAALPKGWAAANDGDNQKLFDLLAAAGLLDDEQLIAHLLRRADEERIATLARSRTDRREARVLQGLISDENGAVAAAAMALVMGRGRRRDRMGQCLVTIDDLPQGAAERVVYAIAAALRSDMSSVRGSAASDGALARASAEALNRRDPARGLDSLVSNLVGMFDSTGLMSDEFLLDAASEGEVTFVAHALARRAGIDADTAIDELVSGAMLRAMGLLRMAGASRQFAASLLATAGDFIGLVDPGGAIEAFDKMTAVEIEAIRAWLHADARYRKAANTLGGRRG